MKTLPLVVCLFVSSVACADNIFSYDNNARAAFENTESNTQPEAPVYVDYGSVPSNAPNPSDTFNQGIQEQQNQREMDNLNAQAEDYNRNSDMRYYQAEERR